MHKNQCYRSVYGEFDNQKLFKISIQLKNSLITF